MTTVKRKESQYAIVKELNYTRYKKKALVYH